VMFTTVRVKCDYNEFKMQSDFQCESLEINNGEYKGNWHVLA